MCRHLGLLNWFKPDPGVPVPATAVPVWFQASVEPETSMSLQNDSSERSETRTNRRPGLQWSMSSLKPRIDRSSIQIPLCALLGLVVVADVVDVEKLVDVLALVTLVVVIVVTVVVDLDVVLCPMQTRKRDAFMTEKPHKKLHDVECSPLRRRRKAHFLLSV